MDQEQKALLRYFINETNKRFDKLDKKLDEYGKSNHEEIQHLKKFKFTWTGGLIVLNVLISTAVTIGVAMLRGH